MLRTCCRRYVVLGSVFSFNIRDKLGGETKTEQLVNSEGIKPPDTETGWDRLKKVFQTE